MCYIVAMRKRIKVIAYLILGVVVLSLLAHLVSLLTGSLEISQFTYELGILGPIFLILGVAFGGIFVPMTSLPFLLAGLALYGFWPTFIIFYIGNTILAPIVDFWVARKYGRTVVAKLAGKRALQEIDKIVEVSGVKVLIVLRTLGGLLFDSISYAVGLTNMNFRTYVLATATLPIPAMLGSLYLTQQGLTNNPLFFGLLVFWGYGAAVLVSVFIMRERNKKSV